MSLVRTISSAAERIAVVSAVGLSAVAGVGLAPAAGGSPVSAHRGQAGHQLLPAGRSWTVTLITGDVVHVTTVRGRPPLVAVTPRPGAGRAIFTKFVDSRDDIEVIPADVGSLIGRVLDPALFSVTTLIQNRDDDAHRSFLPLIVQGSPSSLTALPSLTRGLSLSSIGAVAATESRRAAVRVGGALAAMASAVTRTGQVMPQATGGISHIWLDRTVRVTDAVPARLLADIEAHRGVLDHNLVQIGAPVAWRAGDTGAGIKVAVLDTGVDATFPDLRGQIVARRNFTTRHPHVADDRFGHGTFVAALIAGTGRAAAGERRGVAFGARLVIGKVLNDQGFGQESWAIAGMQWAAARARIVSMSFSTGPSNGSDPMAHALNQLAATHHVLFVAAAGNFGPGDETVGAPAVARAALAVGAVDGRDRLASFSSRGPVPNSFAIKPEITAPGVNITGARAAGTSLGTPIDAHYAVASGTSFSTPEVAGAAAILAALHPSWSSARLKADLVSTAHQATGGDFYAVGGGRVDIGAAVTDPVAAAKAIANLGAAGASARVVRTGVTWDNTSGHGAELTLSAELTDHFGHAAPERAFALTTTRVRLPAGGKATVGIALKPRVLGRPGLYEGQIVARDGKITIRTPLNFYLRPPTETLTLRATPLPGTAPSNFSAFATIVDVSDPDILQSSASLFQVGRHGTLFAKVKVPAGRYWIMGIINDGNSFSPIRQAIVGRPEVNVTRNGSVLLNGAGAVPATATVTGRATIIQDGGIHVERALPSVVDGIDLNYFGSPTTTSPFYVNLSGSPHVGSFHAYSWFRLSNLPGSKSNYVYDLYHLISTKNPGTADYQITPAQQAKLAKITVHFYAIDGNTAPVGDTRYGLTPAGFLSVQNVNPLLPGGSTRTDYLSTGPEITWDQEAAPPIYYKGVNQGLAWISEVPGFTSYTSGSRHVLNWAREPFAPGPYSGTKFTPSFCAPLPSTRVHAYIHVELVDLQDLPDGFDCLGGQAPVTFWAAGTSRVMRLFHGSRLLGTSHQSFGTFTVPPQAATYRLSYADNTSQVLPVSTRTFTTWTFRSAAPAGSAQVELPLLLVRYHLPLKLDNHPDGSSAILTVTRVAGTPRASVRDLRLWTSVDGGKTWHAAPVHALGNGKFVVILPHVKAGQGVSLHVMAGDVGGSTIDQTIITAYHG